MAATTAVPETLASPAAGHRRWPVIVLGVLLVVAAAVRLPSLVDPPTDFHVTRQYNGALLAHSHYVDLAPASAMDRHIARLDPRR